MAEELTAEQKKEKAEAIDKVITSCADAGAKTFEDFLRENPNASLEEKHNQLVQIIKSNFLITSIMVHGV
jgi:hypothetical protein